MFANNSYCTAFTVPWVAVAQWQILTKTEFITTSYYSKPSHEVYFIKWSGVSVWRLTTANTNTNCKYCLQQLAKGKINIATDEVSTLPAALSIKLPADQFRIPLMLHTKPELLYSNFKSSVKLCPIALSWMFWFGHFTQLTSKHTLHHQGSWVRATLDTHSAVT